MNALKPIPWAPFRLSMHDAQTLRPPTYPELERELYLSLEPETERETVPAPEPQA